MALTIIGLLTLIAAGSGALLLISRIRLLNATTQAAQRLPDAARYRPMLRLLSPEDLELADGSPKLRQQFSMRRRAIFRGYLRCLTRDYALLLAGIRRTMVESGADRPDLTKALAKNRLMFALALCRIEVSLRLHALGIGKVDVSGLVEALDALRGAVTVMTPASVAAY